MPPHPINRPWKFTVKTTRITIRAQDWLMRQLGTSAIRWWLATHSIGTVQIRSFNIYRKHSGHKRVGLCQRTRMLIRISTTMLLTLLKNRNIYNSRSTTRQAGAMAPTNQWPTLTINKLCLPRKATASLLLTLLLAQLINHSHSPKSQIKATSACK